jgi:hypothetical protein
MAFSVQPSMRSEASEAWQDLPALSTLGATIEITKVGRDVACPLLEIDCHANTSNCHSEDAMFLSCRERIIERKDAFQNPLIQRRQPNT